MEFCYSYADTVHGKTAVTEVICYENEGVVKDMLIAALLDSAMAYDQKMLPERIVLEGNWSRERISQLLARRSGLGNLSPSGLPLRLLYGQTIIEMVKPSEDYL